MKSNRVDLIVAKLKKARGMDSEPQGEESEEAGESSEMGLDSAAESILSAVKGGDAASLKSALKSFVSMCGSKSEEYDEEE